MEEVPLAPTAVKDPHLWNCRRGQAPLVYTTMVAKRVGFFVYFTSKKVLLLPFLCNIICSYLSSILPYREVSYLLILAK